MMLDLTVKLNQVASIILPKNLPSGSVSSTPTFSTSSSDQALPTPDRQSHTKDILDYRQSTNDSDIVKDLAKTDSDVSTTVSSYLAVANTKMAFVCNDISGAVDRNAQALVNQILLNLTTTLDYSSGFTGDKSLESYNALLRYQILVSGACCGELIQNKKVALNVLSDFRLVNPDSLEWYEKTVGRLTPVQKSSDGSDIDLDIPTFFYSSHHQDPNSAYAVSPFVSVINSIYARKRIIEDLYRMMSINGYPRIKIKVLEETIMKYAPEEVKRGDQVKKQNYLQSYISVIQNAYSNVKSDQPLVFTDSYDVDVLETKGVLSLDITPIISILNSQNQTALKIVGTILGRGENGVNTASAETRVFLKNVEDLNSTVARLWSQALTFALRLSGSSSYVKVFFEKPSFNSEVEDAPKKVVNQSILQKDLSLGIITDDEYCLAMWGRLSLPNAPVLSGTGFLNSKGLTEVVNTPNDPKGQPDSYQRSGDPDSSNVSNDNNVK